jgi:peroxiredoxin
MTLETKLAAERQKRAGNTPLQAALREVIAGLAGGVLEHALRVGEPFPDFLLPDAEGTLVSRDALLARGPLIIAFLRGGWCPFCTTYLAALMEALPAIRAAGGSLAVATPETGGRALDMQRFHQASCAVLADVDSGLAAACGVLFRVPYSYRAVLEGFRIDLTERQGNSAWVLPVPATFVVGRNGRVIWRHLDADFTRRAEPADILHALE